MAKKPDPTPEDRSGDSTRESEDDRDSPDGFEVFEAQQRPKRLEPDEVSLTKTNIVISDHFHQVHFAGVKRVLLLYNSKTQTVGICPTHDAERSYKLSYRSISSVSFYSYFGIEARGRFKARFEDGALLVDLSAD